MDDVIEIALDILGEVAEALISSNKTPAWLRNTLIIIIGILALAVIVGLFWVAFQPGNLPLRIFAAFGATVLMVACAFGLHHLLQKQQDNT